MKKYWKIILIVGVVLFGICIYLISKGSYSVEVDNRILGLEIIDETVAIECESGSKLSKDTSVSCLIRGVGFSKYVSSFSADLVLGDGLVLKTILNNTSNWQGDSADGDVDIYTDVNKNGDFVVSEFVIESDGKTFGIDSQLTLENIVISDENFDEFKIESVNTKVSIASNDADLKSLIIDNIDFEFSKDIVEYNLSTSEESITINVSAANENATVSGAGIKDINTGINTFEIVVTAEDGTTKTYTIVITRSDLSINFAEDVVVNENKKQLILSSKNLTVGQMLEKITTDATVIIVDDLGNEKTSNDFVGTGNKVKVYSSDELMEQYILVVSGDVNGDGKISLEDIKDAEKYYLGVKTFDKDEYISAVDFNKDNKISINDIIKLSKYIFANK